MPQFIRAAGYKIRLNLRIIKEESQKKIYPEFFQQCRYIIPNTLNSGRHIWAM